MFAVVFEFSLVAVYILSGQVLSGSLHRTRQGTRAF